MPRPLSSLDQFLFKFDYVSKVKFVIGIAIFAALCLMILLIKTNDFFLENINEHLQGIENQQHLNTLLKKVIDYELIFFKSQTANTTELLSLRNEIELAFINLNKIFKKQKENKEKHEVGLIQLIEENFNLSTENWKNAKLESITTSSLLRQKLVEELGSLIKYNSQLYQMNLNMDTLTSLLMHSYTIEIPTAQTSKNRLLNHLKVIFPRKPTPEEKTKIIIDKIAFQTAVNEISDDIKIIHNNSMLDETIITKLREKDLDFSKSAISFNVSIDKFLAGHFTEKDSDKFLEEAKRLFDTSYDFNNEVAFTLNSVLLKQKKLIIFRSFFGASLLVFGIIIVLTLFMTRVIRRPLSDLKDAAETLAKGNLAVRIKITSNDEVAEISRAFNRMAAFFEKVMLNAYDISTHLANSASNVFSTAKQLESSVTNQEKSISQISDNAQGISRTVQDFELSLQDVNNAAALTGYLADLGKNSLYEMETIMQKMANASIRIVATLSALEEKIGSINTIINTIINISDQINLLSLNTSIRAGKLGMKPQGFSIIAEKIRELAYQTAYATLDIEQAVQTIVSSVNQTAKEVGSFSTQVQNILEEATEIREQLKKLIAHTQNQISAFERINKGMQEQTTRASQIHSSIYGYTEAAKKTTLSVRNLYLEIEYLYYSTSNLEAMTKKFTEKSLRVPALPHLQNNK